MTEATSLPKKGRPAPVAKPEQSILYPFNWIFFGSPGVGKTTTADHAPDSVIVKDTQERTIDRLKRAGELTSEIIDLPRCPRKEDNVLPDETHPWEIALETITNLPSQHPNKRTAILDSLTGFQKICFDYACRKEYGGNWTHFMSYVQGPKTAAHHHWPQLFDALDEIQDQGWNIICIAHEQTKSFPDPEFGNYDKFMPYLEKDVWQNTHRWAQMVLRMAYRKKEASQRGELKKRMRATGERVVYTQPDAIWDAKAPTAMDSEILMGNSAQESWDHIWDAYRRAMGL